MGTESAFFQQWVQAETKPRSAKPSEQEVAGFGRELSPAEIEQKVADISKVFRLVDDYFFPVLELFTDDEDPEAIELFASELQSLKGAVREQLEHQGYGAVFIEVGLALLDVPAVIVSQASAHRRMRNRPDVAFHQLPEAERQSVYLLSSWQQAIADYFIAFNEQPLSSQQISAVYNQFERQWLDYTRDAKALVQKLIPDITEQEYREAVNFQGYKRGIWGTVGVALELFRQGYQLRWSTPETDVLRKIDMIASRRGEEKQWAISVKGWSNMIDHVAIRHQQDLEGAPHERQQALHKEWSALRRGIEGYKREQGLTTPVDPLIMVVASDRQDGQSGRLRFSQRVEGVQA